MGVTPFQTVGPFLSIGFRAGLAPMTSAAAGAPIEIRGRLIDGEGAGVPDGVLEFWHPAFADIGRVLTGDGGAFTLAAAKPPLAPGADGRTVAPHFAVRVLGRGILTQYLTRVYFDDEPDTAHDPTLALVPADRRATLVARATGPRTYAFDIVLQGLGETVFFDV
jgi:protocatechuate 3,4-dioxygenase alpha subunit